MPVEKHYTGQELADMLRVDYETVLRLAQEGVIRSVRIGRLRRFPDSAVREYLDNQSDDGGAQILDFPNGDS